MLVQKPVDINLSPSIGSESNFDIIAKRRRQKQKDQLHVGKAFVQYKIKQERNYKESDCLNDASHTVRFVRKIEEEYTLRKEQILGQKKFASHQRDTLKVFRDNNKIPPEMKYFDNKYEFKELSL